MPSRSSTKEELPRRPIVKYIHQTIHTQVPVYMVDRQGKVRGASACSGTFFPRFQRSTSPLLCYHHHLHKHQHQHLSPHHHNSSRPGDFSSELTCSRSCAPRERRKRMSLRIFRCDQKWSASLGVWWRLALVPWVWPSLVVTGAFAEGRSKMPPQCIPISIGNEG